MDQSLYLAVLLAGKNPALVSTAEFACHLVFDLTYFIVASLVDQRRDDGLSVLFDHIL